MSDFLNILTHERRLRANTKELSVSELEDVKEKLGRVIAARVEEEAEQRQAEAEKQARVEAIRKQMEDAGLNLEDLAPELATTLGKGKQKAKRVAKQAKYQYQADGENKTWTGQGRTPKVIQQALDKGKSLKDFLIK